VPLHCQKEKEKEIQKKRNIKSRKIDKRKRKILVLTHIIILYLSSFQRLLLLDNRKIEKDEIRLSPCSEVLTLLYNI